jgi:hypothetical protein
MLIGPRRYGAALACTVAWGGTHPRDGSDKHMLRVFSSEQATDLLDGMCDDMENIPCRELRSGFDDEIKLRPDSAAWTKFAETSSVLLDRPYITYMKEQNPGCKTEQELMTKVRQSADEHWQYQEIYKKHEKGHEKKCGEDGNEKCTFRHWVHELCLESKSCKGTSVKYYKPGPLGEAINDKAAHSTLFSAEQTIMLSPGTASESCAAAGTCTGADDDETDDAVVEDADEADAEDADEAATEDADEADADEADAEDEDADETEVDADADENAEDEDSSIFGSMKKLADDVVGNLMEDDVADAVAGDSKKVKAHTKVKAAKKAKSEKSGVKVKTEKAKAAKKAKAEKAKTARAAKAEKAKAAKKAKSEKLGAKTEKVKAAKKAKAEKAKTAKAAKAEKAKAAKTAKAEKAKAAKKAKAEKAKTAKKAKAEKAKAAKQAKAEKAKAAKAKKSKKPKK